MPQTRGFVMQIEVGRAALVTVTLATGSATTSTFVIPDLDADPERFNERLSKLGLLRDAMNRAEPVLVDHHDEQEVGEVVDAVRRISRDALAPPSGELQVVTGVVVAVSIESQNAAEGDGEHHDRAVAAVLDLSVGVTRTVIVDLQGPERGTALAQFGLLKDSHANGSAVHCLVDSSDPIGLRVLRVANDVGHAGQGGETTVVDVDGFVEALSLLQQSVIGGGASLVASFALVRLTTAPPFHGPGNLVDPYPFAPAPIDVMVPKGSLAYDLFEAALRDGLRVRTQVTELRRRETEPRPVPQVAASVATVTSGAGAGDGESDPVRYAFAAELLAPLASAARPVWTRIERESLDQGTETLPCAPDSPSSDLSVQTLRDLRIPYRAAWRGWACANSGVYRFQIRVSSPVRLIVNGCELCLLDAGEGYVKLAHACLHGDVEVTVELDAWTCDQEFQFDVYRLR